MPWTSSNCQDFSKILIMFYTSKQKLQMHFLWKIPWDKESIFYEKCLWNETFYAECKLEQQIDLQKLKMFHMKHTLERLSECAVDGQLMIG